MDVCVCVCVCIVLMYTSTATVKGKNVLFNVRFPENVMYTRLGAGPLNNCCPVPRAGAQRRCGERRVLPLGVGGNCE